MDPVSRNLESEDTDARAPDKAVADLKTQLGDLQIGGGGDMLIDDYDAVDEKQDVAIITPDDSPEELEPLADDCMRYILEEKRSDPSADRVYEQMKA